MKKNVVVLAEAANDIELGIDIYNAIEDGVGLYFTNSPATRKKLGREWREQANKDWFAILRLARVPSAVRYTAYG